MSKSRIGFVMRIVVVTMLLSGMAAGLTACPEKGEGSSVRDRPDNHAPNSHAGMGGGMGM